MLRWTLLTVLMASSGLLPARAQSLISPTKAARYGLTRAWFAQVGSKGSTGELAHVSYDDGLVLVQSSRGMITAIEAETGRTLWETGIGSREGSNSEPAANDKYVVVVNGSTLCVIHRPDGRLVWKRRLSGAPGAGPAVSGTHAFVPLISGLIEGYDLEAGAKQTPWNYKSAGRVLTSPVTTDSSLCWTTERGYLYVAGPSADGVRYRLETSAEIHSRPAAWYPRLFAGSVDGYVYAVNEKEGEIDWKFPVGEPIFETPVAINDRLLVVTEFAGMYCLSAEQGEPLWHVTNVSQFVAASPTRVYVRDRTHRLSILDLQSGARLGTMPLDNISIAMPNHRSDRIFLVDESCVIQCLHETQLAEPVLYTPPEPEEKEVQIVPRKRAATEESAAEPESAEPGGGDSFFDAPAEGAESEDKADNPFGDFP